MKKIVAIGVLTLACAWLSRPGNAVEDEGCSDCELAAKMLVPDLSLDLDLGE